MRINEIEVGVHYAYKAHSYATEREVEVLETRVLRKEGYSWSKREVRNGVKVRFVKDDQIAVVPSREISETWFKYAERKARQDEAATRRRNEEVAQLHSRAALAQQIEESLAASDVVATRRRVRQGYVDYYREAGFTVEEEQREWSENRTVTDHYANSRFDVDTLLAQGSVDEAVVRHLIGALV